jgi:hypothetical protein
MGTVMATCPITGRDVEIGVDTDKRSLAAAQRFFALLLCPSCADEHALSYRDGVCETIGRRSEYSPKREQTPRGCTTGRCAKWLAVRGCAERKRRPIFAGS